MIIRQRLSVFIPPAFMLLLFALLLWLSAAIFRMPDNHAHLVWKHLLLPRFLAALMAGASLGLAGAVLQIITRNPLSSPSVLGVTSGGQIGLLLGFMLPAAWRPLSIVAVFAGCMSGAFITFLIAGGKRAQPLRLILAGTACNVFLLALVTLLLVLNERHIAGLALWQAGSLFHENIQAVWHTLPWLIVALLLIVYSARALSLLALGEQQAYVLGVKVEGTSFYALLVAVLLTAVAVTLAGPVAFVGLIAPHLARMLGFRHPYALLKTSPVAGMAVVLIADAVVQLFMGHFTVPLGLMTALVGTPMLIWLVLKQPAQPAQPETTTDNNPPLHKNTILPLLVAVLLLPVVMYLGLRAGLTDLETNRWWLVLRQTGQGGDSLLVELRMARLILAAICGALLATGGWLMQQMMRNPLASPEITGLTQGAALAVLLCLLYWPDSGQGILSVAALMGAGSVLALLLWLNQRHDFKPATLLVCGLALSGLISAGTTLLIILFKVQAAQAVIWLSGSLYGQSLANAQMLLPALLLLLPALFLLRWLSILRLGDEQAQVLGLPVIKVRLLVLALAATLTALAVSFAGPVAFVGLLAPHVANQWVGQNRLSLSLLMSMVCGALLCVFADSLGRSAFAPLDIPLGLMTTLIGAPYLLALMARRNSGSGI